MVHDFLYCLTYLDIVNCTLQGFEFDAWVPLPIFRRQACDLLPVLRASRASLHLEPLCAGAPPKRLEGQTTAGKANNQHDDPVGVGS